MQSPDALMTSSDATTNAGGTRRHPASRAEVAAGMYQAGSGPDGPVPVSSANGTASAGTSTSGSAASASALSSASLTSTISSANSVLVIGSLLAPDDRCSTEGSQDRGRHERGRSGLRRAQ